MTVVLAPDEARDAIEPDLPRMRRERHARVQEQMRAKDVDALLLITSGHVLYATGAWWPAADNGRTTHLRTAALVVAGDEFPYLFTPFPQEAPPELPADHVLPALRLETESGVRDLARRIDEVLGGRPLAKLGLDDLTFPMHAHLAGLLPGVKLAGATPVLVEARLAKTPDEIACMRRSWRITEQANIAAEQACVSGNRLTDVTGAFFQRLFELGESCNFLDPVFQAMPPHIADGPWSTNGDVPFALPTTDHVLQHGDVVWTDTVSGYEGYASDVGRTWIVGRPSAVQRDLRAQWEGIVDAVLAVTRPGATGDELTAAAVAANGGEKPWLAHYFLGHTLGLEGGEPQRIGSDLGPAFDEGFVLAPGMTLVLEPVTWRDGHAGYRCEELVVITEDGYERISDYPMADW